MVGIKQNVTRDSSPNVGIAGDAGLWKSSRRKTDCGHLKLNRALNIKHMCSPVQCHPFLLSRQMGVLLKAILIRTVL